MAFADRRWSAETCVERRVEDLGGRRTVHVLIAGEGGQQAFVAGEVSHDPKLDLRVVGGEQLEAGWRYECLADPAAFGRANRNVL